MSILNSTATLISDDTRSRIRDNYLQSERAARFRPFYLGGFVLVAAIAGAALFVDYMIITEFWTRALADEFLELPGTLATSVTFKSLQVLFATIAAHILFEHMGAFGRGLFVRIVFLLALMMLAGVGLLLALMSLPNGISSVSGGSVGDSLGDALSGLGIATSGTQEAVRTQSEIEAMRGYQPLFWMGSLGVIFLVVTGVAALCLHYALEHIRRLLMTRDYKSRSRDLDRLAALERDYAAQRAALAEMEGPENRRHMLWNGLMGECRAYARGLDEARFSLEGTPAQGGLFKRRKQAAREDRLQRLNECRSQQTIERYEQLFDQWWERRSRQAMGAGRVSDDGVREPFGQIVSPSVTSLTARRRSLAAE